MLDAIGMEYGSLVSEAWRLTWRFRSLWVLGLFAGGTAGSSFSFSGPNQRTTAFPRNTNPQTEEITRQITAWVTANIGLLVAIGLIVLVLVLVGIVLSLISQGALTRAGADAARGGTPTLGAAWSAGLRLFWRYVGLALLFILLAIGVAILFGALFGIATLGGGEAARPLALVLLGIIGIVVGVAAAATISFAQRAIAVDDLGPAAALQRGWSIFTGHIGTSIGLLVVYIVLAIAVGIALAITSLIVAIPFLIVGAILYFSTGVGGLLVLWGIIGVLAFLVAVFVAAAIAGTFLWHFWTLAYLRLSAAAVPAAAPA